MGRLITTEGPGKMRDQHRRTIAEMLRRLSQKPQFDQEARDQAALIVFSLHGIVDTVEQTTEAWEKRDYYLKADRFREEWRWVEPAIEELSAIIYKGQWERLPLALAALMPHFADVKVKQLTRTSLLWRGAYDKFMRQS